jgi:cell division control protein 24
MQADASIDKETRDDATLDLFDRIDDWKTISMSTLGELLMLGTFQVMKDSTSKSDEKEYYIYLFSRILIMCKDVNANKAKNRLANTKPVLSRSGKPKMNLKGRIYFNNVSTVTPHSTPGHYTLAITWKNDSQGMENFVIRFKNDDTLKKWHDIIETQRSACMLESRQTGTTSDTQLLSLQGMNMENPYLGQDDEDDFSRLSGTTYGGTDVAGYSEFNPSRNASSTSLRSRSATGGSGGSNPHMSGPRVRIPTGEMGGLSLNTRGLPTPSPHDYVGGSYFSPIERESTPQSTTISARSSSQSAFAGYHRGTTTPVSGGNHRPEESHRNTAPAMARNPNGQSGGNPYLGNGRTRGPPQAPGMPRMRSASSPDVHPLVQQSRKYVSGEHVPTVPPIPAHMAKQMAPPSRSQNNSPSNGPPSRGSTPHQHSYGLPAGPRPTMPTQSYTYDPSYGNDPRSRPGHAPSLSQGRPFSPPVSSPSSDGDSYIPSQLKAKICFDENYVSMIIPGNIQFRSLADRVDAKLMRFTNHSIASGSVRLRYQDEDGDFILIDSDEAVHEALLNWRETHTSNPASWDSTELLLFAHAINGEAVAGG